MHRAPPRAPRFGQFHSEGEKRGEQTDVPQLTPQRSGTRPMPQRSPRAFTAPQGRWIVGAADRPDETRAHLPPRVERTSCQVQRGGPPAALRASDAGVPCSESPPLRPAGPTRHARGHTARAVYVARPAAHAHAQLCAPAGVCHVSRGGEQGLRARRPLSITPPPPPASPEPEPNVMAGERCAHGGSIGPQYRPPERNGAGRPAALEWEGECRAGGASALLPPLA